jgi:membrane-bound lytic murein transglycosylase B
MIRILTALPLLVTFTLNAAPITPDIQSRLVELSGQTNTPLPLLEKAVKEAKLNQTVIDAIQRPWEAKPWFEYAPLFLTEPRVEKSIEFWTTHQATLERAEKTYQVPAQIIVAIIGVETYFGRHAGTYSVLDSLYSLGFHYPKRGQFFSKEFAYYVTLCQQQNWSLTDTLGSYAGAMGYGQFIPSSYLHYAVDFDGDNKIDLLNNPVDAIGSVANYFHQHHWKLGESVAHQATQTPTNVVSLTTKDLKPQTTWQALQNAQLQIDTALPADEPVNLIQLFEAKNQPSYWVTQHNFYVITRYNRSPLYAMAVYQLSERIRQAYEQH